MQSLSRNQLKFCKSLSSTKGRKKHNSFFAEGDRSVLQLLENNFVQPVHIILRDESDLKRIPAPFQKYSILAKEDEFLDISLAVTPQNICGIFEIPAPGDISHFAKQSGNLLYLDRIQDPGNLGTIYRTAAWFGFAGIILAKGTADLFQPKVVRSTAGATNSLPYLMDDDGSVLSKLKDSGWHCYVTTLDDESVSLDVVHFTDKNIIIIGNEGSGVSEDICRLADTKVHIPGSAAGLVESLNAAVSAGIIMSKLP